MRRFLAILGCDIRVQYRSGFYWVGLAALAFWLIILPQIKRIEIIDFTQFLPVFLSTNLIMTTTLFMAGLALLEKAEGTLDALVVTPLRPSHYLWSKTLTLSVLAAAETAGAALIIYDGPVQVVPLLLGLCMLGGIFALIGFALAVRFDGVNSFLPPAIAVITVLLIPLVPHFGLWRHPVLELHPAEPAFHLFRLALPGTDNGGITSPLGLYAVGASLVWLCICFLWARSAFETFITRRAGG